MNRPVDKKFWKKVGWINGLGIFITVLGPLIIDPRLKSHVQFPNRPYTYNWFWLLISIPVGLATYYFGHGWKLRGWPSRTLNTIVPALGLLLSAFIVAFLFPPEFPHVGIIVWAFAYSFVSLFTVFFHLGRQDSDQFPNTSAALHRLKATISWWKQITLYAAAGYLAFAIFLASVAWTINSVMLTNQRERFFFGNAQMIQILVYSVFILIGPLNEAFQTTQYHIAKLSPDSRNT